MATTRVKDCTSKSNLDTNKSVNTNSQNNRKLQQKTPEALEDMKNGRKRQEQHRSACSSLGFSPLLQGSGTKLDRSPSFMSPFC